MDLVIHFAITAILLGWEGIHSERKVCVYLSVPAGEKCSHLTFSKSQQASCEWLPLLKPSAQDRRSSWMLLHKKTFSKFSPS